MAEMVSVSLSKVCPTVAMFFDRGRMEDFTALLVQKSDQIESEVTPDIWNNAVNMVVFQILNENWMKKGDENPRDSVVSFMVLGYELAEGSLSEKDQQSQMNKISRAAEFTDDGLAQEIREEYRVGAVRNMIQAGIDVFTSTRFEKR